MFGSFVDRDVSRCFIVTQKKPSLGSGQQDQDERLSRILTSALEVFSESSFQDATTDEIARRAKVSKRDIYATFPNKHALLLAVLDLVLEADDENFSRVISLTNSASLNEVLEIVGLALMNEILSPATGFLSRLVSSESIHQPELGVIFFENWYSRRAELIAAVLQAFSKRSVRTSSDSSQAARHFVALVAHRPQLSVFMGMRDTWGSRSAQTHVKGAVDFFLKAYPERR